MNLKELFAQGVVGKVVYDPTEDQFILRTKCIDFGLSQIWNDYEEEEINISIKIQGELK